MATAIIGVGNLGSTVARHLVAGDEPVVLAAADKAHAQELADELERFDPTLAKAASRSRRKMEYQIQKIERKVARQILLRDATARQHAATLTGLLYPHKHLQERFYSILPLLAQHGLDLPSQMYEHVRLDCPDHQLVTI